jgi:hypothetical protein
MIEQILKNREQAQKDGAVGMEEVLGSRKNVAKMSYVWKNYKDVIQLGKASLLLDFCNTQSFTADELNHYRLGLDAMVKLFEESSNEIDILEKAAKSLDK